MGHSTRRLMMGAAGAGEKTYVGDVFSTYLYKGNAGDSNPNETQTITNGVDLAGKGGLVWCKYRHTGLGSAEHVLVDTVRGVNKYIMSNDTAAEATTNSVNAFNSNGFQLKGSGPGGGSNRDDSYYSSWTFREQKGFFDIVTYTGTGSAQSLAHGLGSVPGCIMIKRLDAATYDWAVYHSALTAGDYLKLNLTVAAASGNNRFDQGVPTSTNFAIGTSSDVNANGGSYVAYLFAGGESTAATARSVDFDGSGDYLSLASSSDFSMGTGDFTIECWVKADHLGSSRGVFQLSGNAGGLDSSTTNISVEMRSNKTWGFYYGSSSSTAGGTQSIGQWYHVAYVRASGKSKLYINGTELLSVTDTTDYTASNLAIGGYYSTSYLMDGSISNFRVVKGTAVYTSSFRPPTEPLANITNTKLLCCNNSSTTGSTVTPGTITANGDPTASIDSPFDDPAGFKFGEGGDQNIVKCGSYVGNGSESAGPNINLGWEPQWFLWKRSDSSSDWTMVDCMRQLGPTGIEEKALQPNSSGAEHGAQYVSPTSTGWQTNNQNNNTNVNGGNYIYIAIRRPDGYVGKPAEAGTDVFAMDTGASSSTIPDFDSGFPVDFAFTKSPASGGDEWYTSTRLTSGKYVKLNATAAEATLADFTFDSNVGWSKNNDPSSVQSWMFKRHAGFDVVTFAGQDVAGRQIAHSLSKTPEMIFVKARSGTSTAVQDWRVYHKGLNGGTTPENYYLTLNTTAAENNTTGMWNDTAPTSTHVTLGNSTETNAANRNYLMMLFASVDGISKVGSYTGTGSSTMTITTGFQPRFLVIKRSDGAENWVVVDTTRGWSAGNDQVLFFNTTNAQQLNSIGDPTSTGFTINPYHGWVNTSGHEYIYYAHA